jgi:NTP pyrophosphatase (non-canonical NTP hydrolase)
MKLTNEFETIRDWAKKRGIYESGDPKTQFLKLIEEVGELGKAILKDDKEETIDAIGDIVVVLTNLTVLCRMYKEGKDFIGQIDDVQIEDCINSAYLQIKLRTGKMQNGTFVKD